MAEQDLEDRVVYINRVSKAVSGGTTMSFSTMVAVGNEDGKVGIAIGQDEEVPDSIEKARGRAEDDLVSVQRMGSTIPHEIEVEHDAARVLLKPAAPGTGVIAGGAVRAVLEMAGVDDILTKSLGSDNPLNIARATLKGLRQLKDPHKVAQLRDVPVEQLLNQNPYASDEDYETPGKDTEQSSDDSEGDSTASADNNQTSDDDQTNEQTDDGNSDDTEQSEEEPVEA